MHAHLEFYLRSLDMVLCGKYSLSMGFVALKNGLSYDLVGANLTLNPIPHPSDDFIVETEGLLAGHQTFNNISKYKIFKIIHEATVGKIHINSATLVLDQKNNLSYFTDLIDETKWFSEFLLRVNSSGPSSIDQVRMREIDNELRRASPCFDGLEDILRYVGLQYSYNTVKYISIRALPPIDIVFSQCSFTSNYLTIPIRALSTLNIDNISLSIRSVSGNTRSRIQVAKNINWERPKKGLRTGVLSMYLDDTEAVFVMLMVGNVMVRRQWIEDPSKTTNVRLIASAAFDKDLKQINKYLSVEANESRKFESAVVELLYILGFAPMKPLDSDAPDIIASTPLGKILIIECTLKISDIHSKIGKLVNRRGKLIDALKDGGHSVFNVIAVLVCAESPDKISSIEVDSWQKNQILLVTKSDIESLMRRLKYSDDPDKIIDDALSSNFVQRGLFKS